MSGGKPLVGLVTPVWNEEEYLAECLESVLAQTYPAWRLVVVDNGSTDASAAVAQSFAERDTRITVRRNERHLPLLESLNRAFALLPDGSVYCKPVLGDDALRPPCLERMVDLAESEPSVGLVCSPVETETTVTGTGLPTDREVFSGLEVCARQFSEGSFYFGSPTAQMWRAEIVRGRRPFYRTGFHPDTDACYDLLGGWDFGFVHEPLTFRRTLNDSVTSRTAGFDREFVDGLVMLTRYGTRYLPADDHAARMRDMWRTYRLQIGESAVRGRPEAYWAHHREAMAEVGVSLSGAFKARCAASWLAHALRHPVRLARRVSAGVRRAAAGATAQDGDR